MFIKNNDFYFNSNSCIHLDNLKFRRLVKKYKNKNYYNNYTIRKTGDLRVEFKFTDNNIYVDIGSRSYEVYCNYLCDLPTTNNDFLLLIKKVVDAIYNSLLVIKKYNMKINIELIKLSTLKSLNSNTNYDTSNNMIYINNDSSTKLSVIQLYIANNNYDNMIVIYIPYGWYREINYISIQGNKLIFSKDNSEKVIIYYPKDFGYNLNKKIEKSYVYVEPYITLYKYIEKQNRNIYIHYLTPQSILLKYFKNINIFKDIEKLNIENEYDLLKYL